MDVPKPTVQARGWDATTAIMARQGADGIALGEVSSFDEEWADMKSARFG
jgi:hypothetical protein